MKTIAACRPWTPLLQASPLKGARANDDVFLSAPPAPPIYSRRDIEQSFGRRLATGVFLATSASSALVGSSQVATAKMVTDPLGLTRITDPGTLVAGGGLAELQKFYLNHGNQFVPDCSGKCAFGKPKVNEELGLCQGTAVLAHVSGRTQLPASALPQLLDGEFQISPLNSAAALQAAGDKDWNLISYQEGQPHHVLNGVLQEVKQHGSAILGMNYTRPDGTQATGHALLVTDVRQGKALYTKTDGSTEERPAVLFYYLDPEQRDGLPEEPGSQQAIVLFSETNQASWTRDVREFYQPEPDASEKAVPQGGTYLKKGEIDYGTVDQTQLKNALARLQQGADYFARTSQEAKDR